MTCVAVTGATGLIGSNICSQLLDQGKEVRALVRDPAAASGLADLGVELVAGDVTERGDVDRLVQGADQAVHSAAVLGGISQDMDLFQAVNVAGAVNVYEAAAAAGLGRVVALTTTTFFDMDAAPLTEVSPVHADPATDPYTLTKMQAFQEGMARAENGQDICFVIPGGTYGPSPLAERAMVAPSYNQRIVDAANGDLVSSVAFPIPWSYSEDVARVSVLALEKGVSGERYFGFGRPEDVSGTPAFCNEALEIAGSDRRVESIGPDELADPEVAGRFGPSLVALALRDFPEPYFQYVHTLDRLGYAPLSLREGLEITVAWLTEQGFLTVSPAAS